MVKGRPTTRERAERAVETQLEKLVKRASFRDEHIAKARETLRIRVASEEFDGIVFALWNSYMPEDLRALTEGNMREFFAAEPRRLDSSPPGTVSLTDEIYAFRFLPFSHAHHTGGEYAGEGHIYIGFDGENYLEGVFEHAITAELGHHVLRTARPDANSGISELYDFSLSWWVMEELPDYFDHGCMKLRLSDFLTEHQDGEQNSYTLAEQAVAGILSTDNGRYELLSYFFGDEYIDHFIKMEVLPTPDNVKTELAGILFRQFSQMSYEENHTTGWALAWKLLLEIERLTGHKGKGIEAHHRLTDITVKAMYDDAVDFSSPERYIETVVPRLPEYLDNGKKA